MIYFTPSAASRLQQIIGEDSKHFRIKIRGGGCSGFEYDFGLDSTKHDQDFQQTVETSNEGSFSFVIDPISRQYLVGATVDFQSTAAGEQFEINNPNAETTCSCGSSFSAKQTEG